MYIYLKGKLPSTRTAAAVLGHAGLRTIKQEMSQSEAQAQQLTVYRGSEQLLATACHLETEGSEIGCRGLVPPKNPGAWLLRKL